MCIFSKNLFFSIISTKPKDLLAEITITPNPSDAIVTLTAEGYVQTGNSIKVPIGTIVSWKVEKDKYQTRESSFAVTGNANVPVKLSEQPLRTLSINTTPADAAVVITGDGYTNAQGTKAISVPAGTTVTYTVSDPLGQLSLTESGTVVVQEDNAINVVMRTKINVTKVLPPDAEVRINGEILTYKEQTCNQTAVIDVTRDGYDRFYQTLSLNERGIVPDFVQEIELKETVYSLVIESFPIGASLVVTAGKKEYSGIGKIVVSEIKPNTIVNVTVSAEGYETKTESFVMPDNNYEKTISLIETEYIVSILSTPSEASISIIIDGAQEFSGIGFVTTKAKKNAQIEYIVSYQDKEEKGSFVMPNSDFSKNIVLDAGDDTVTLLTDTTTTTLPAGKYRYIMISGGGRGGNGASVGFNTTEDVYGGGGGGSGRVLIGDFTTLGESITFVVGKGGKVANANNSVYAESSSISGDKSGTIASVMGGGSGGVGRAPGYSYIATGGNGDSGGGAGGLSACGSNSWGTSGGNGGISGYDGDDSSFGLKAGGIGIKGEEGLYVNNSGKTNSDDLDLPWPGQGGLGVSRLQSVLLEVDSFMSANADTIRNYMSGGGGGAGTKEAPATYACGSGGGGGGAWTAGEDAHTPAAGSKCLTTGGDGGNGAILYRRIAWS